MGRLLRRCNETGFKKRIEVAHMNKNKEYSGSKKSTFKQVVRARNYLVWKSPKL